jgi:cobalt-zinc-cadmium efflux system outer membrane protein
MSGGVWRKRRAIARLLLGIASTCFGGHRLARAAEPAAPLTLKQVVRSTRQHHPTIIEAAFDTQKAEGKVLSGLGMFDPLLEAKGKLTPHGDYDTGTARATVRQQTGLWGLALVGGWELGRGDFPIYKKDLETSDGGMALVGVELPLLRGGPIDKGRAKLWSARHQQRAARFRLAAITLELTRLAAHHYWNWVAAGRRLRIATKLLEIANTRITQITDRVQRGDLPAIEEIENQRAILKRRGSMIKARRTFEKAGLKLSLFLRDTRGQPIVPRRDQLPQLVERSRSIPGGDELSRDIGRALAHRPELKALNAGRDAVDVSRQLARNDRLPKLNVSALASYDIGSEPFESRRTELMLGLGLRFPLLLREARGAVRTADATLGAIGAKTRLLADKIAMQVRDAHSAIRAAEEQLQVATDEVRVSHRVEQAERERLRLGASTLLLVNLREQAAAEAEFRAVDAAAAVQRALADYRAVTARGLSD